MVVNSDDIDQFSDVFPDRYDIHDSSESVFIVNVENVETSSPSMRCIQITAWQPNFYALHLDNCMATKKQYIYDRFIG